MAIRKEKPQSAAGADGPARALAARMTQISDELTQEDPTHEPEAPEERNAPAETRYARSANLSIAYQVTGKGPDLVFVPGSLSHVELGWETPPTMLMYRRLSRFSRMITFDKRGTGLSDRSAELPTLEERMDDVRAVMDAAQCEKAAVVGISEGGRWRCCSPPRIRRGSARWCSGRRSPV